MMERVVIEREREGESESEQVLFPQVAMLCAVRVGVSKLCPHVVGVNMIVH